MGDVITISIDEGENIVRLLNRMLSIKNENGKEVECNLNGQVLTTRDCNNLEESLIKNNSIIFSEMEKDRDKLINNPVVQHIVGNFKNRGKRYTGEEKDARQIASNISKKETEFNHKITELDTLDFMNPISVYSWLNSIVDYINDVDLHLGIGLDKIEYHTAANYIVKKFEENGYATEYSNEINNLSDYYRKLISYQLNDLDKYQFFIYYYADGLRDKGMLEESVQPKEEELSKLETQTEVERLEPLEALKREKDDILKKLLVLDKYEQGILNSYATRVEDQNSPENFDSRKIKIKQKIEELKNKPIDSKPGNIIEEFTQASKRLNDILPTTDEESEAKEVYSNAAAFPEANSIIKALESASSLPDSSGMKRPLIDAIVKLDGRYSMVKDEGEDQLVKDTMARLNIQPFDSNYSNIDTEMEGLNNELLAIEREQEARTKSIQSTKHSLENRLDEIDQEIELMTATQQVSENQTADSDLSDIIDQSVRNNITGNDLDEDYFDIQDVDSILDNRNDVVEENFADKLARIANEGRIFNDESRGWMGVDASRSADKYNDDSSSLVEPVTKFEEIEDDYDFIPLEESLEEFREIENNNKIIEDDYDLTPLEESRKIGNDNRIIEDGYDLTPREDSLKVPHPIKSIKKASSKLIDAVRNSAFTKVMKDTLKFMWNHKIGIAVLAVATTALIGNANKIQEQVENINTDKNIETNDEKIPENKNVLGETVESIKDTIEEAKSQLAANIPIESQQLQQKSEDELFEEELQNTINSILEGDSRVYISADRAAAEVDGKLPTSRQLENSWANATAGAFYDTNSQVLTREQAEAVIANGGEVVARYDNNGVPIGYATVGQEVTQNTSEVTK